MASQVDKENCLHEYFASEQESQVHYFIVKSLYDGGHLGLLDCKEIEGKLHITRGRVLNVVCDINRCSPEVVTCRENYDYSNFIVTEKGKSVLECPIERLIPEDGILSDNIKAFSPIFLLHQYLRIDWLSMVRDEQGIKITRGENYPDFERLFTSLLQFKNANFLTNVQELNRLQWIETIDEILELIRGFKFPSTNSEKWNLLKCYRVEARSCLQR